LAFETSLPTSASKDVVVFDDGSMTIQTLSTKSIVLNGKIACPWLSVADRDLVMTFYAGNRDSDFTFTNPHDGATYLLRFIDPEPEPRLEPGYVPPKYRIVFNVVGEKT